MTCLRVVCISVLLAMSSIVSSAPFVYNWTDVSSVGSSGSFSGTTGQPFSIVVTLDNGGASNISQTWTISQVVSIAFILNGATLATLDPQHPDYSSTTSSGSYASDASGDLVLVPTSVSGFLSSQAPVISATDPDPVFSWFINGANEVYASGLGGSISSVFAQNVTGNRVASNWGQGAPAPITPPVVATPKAVPVASPFVLGLLGVCMLGLVSIRKRLLK